MKYNLKNFPICGHLKKYCSWCKWKEGFEAELRERMGFEECEDIIKEILGE